MMVIVCALLETGDPLSVTRIVTRLVLGPCAAVGVQVKTPLVELILAPAGAPESRVYVSVWAGTSGSVAETVKLNGFPSVTVLFPIGAITGAAFGPPTVIVIVCET